MVGGGITSPGIQFEQGAGLAATVIVSGGVPGWVNTDVSSLVPGNAGMVIWMALPWANQAYGVRETGAAGDLTVSGNEVRVMGACRVINGYCELYRDGADNEYGVVGIVR
jgi:hypothetical protein